MKWINVKQRMPFKHQEVFVWPFPTDYCCTAQHTDKGWRYSEYVHMHGEEKYPCDVTHWMEIIPPEGE